MIIKIRCSDAIGLSIQRLLSTLVALTIDRPEDLQYEITGDAEPAKGGPRSGARVQYWAKLPKLDDGTFDMAAVDATVRANLRDLGAETGNGIMYSTIVQGTIEGIVMTEPAIRAKRMLKSGSSQRAVQQLFNNGLIDRGPI